MWVLLRVLVLNNKKKSYDASHLFLSVNIAWRWRKKSFSRSAVVIPLALVCIKRRQNTHSVLMPTILGLTWWQQFNECVLWHATYEGIVTTPTRVVVTVIAAVVQTPKDPYNSKAGQNCLHDPVCNDALLLYGMSSSSECVNYLIIWRVTDSHALQSLRVSVMQHARLATRCRRATRSRLKALNFRPWTRLLHCPRKRQRHDSNIGSSTITTRD